MRKIISGVFNDNQQEVRYCNKCGNLASHHYELNRGYGSQFDNQNGHICSLNLCNDCHEDWIEEVINETPIVEDFGTIYPNEHKLVAFIDTFSELDQDMVYYGYDTSKLLDGFNDYFKDNKIDIKNTTQEAEEVDYDKLYLDFFGSEEEVAKAFEEMSYATLYEQE